MAIADTITSMQNHTSNAYTMIGYGTDLTGINKNLENLSSTIFEAFLEALRSPDTLFTNLPKTSDSGSQITLNGTANAPMRITLNPTAISQDGTPTPTNSQDIHTISGNNSIKVEGKNLFTIDNYVSKNGWNITLNNPLKGMEAGYYTISCVNEYPTSGKGSAVIFSNEVNGNRVDGYFTGYDFGNTRFNNSISVTQKQTNANYLIFTPGDSALTQETLGNMKIQIEKGSTATTYTPYVSQTNTIDLTPYNLGSIGNYENRIFKNIPSDTDYSSEREEGAWYIKKNIGKVVLDGSESWDERTNSGGRKQFFCPTTATNIVGLNTSIQYCNYGVFSSSSFNWSSEGQFALLDNTNRFYLGVNNNAVLNDFKTAIASNNVIIYYSKTTPTYTKITGTLENQLENIYKNMLSYKGTTNISQVNNDLPFDLVGSAIQKL